MINHSGKDKTQILRINGKKVRQLVIQQGVEYKGIKSGKEWRIAREDLNNYLGIKTDIKSFERELYIKELESENRELKLKLNIARNNIENLLNVMQEGEIWYMSFLQV